MQASDSASESPGASGPGVPPETAGEVFEHGYTTKAAAGEHGIGLALTKLVCEHHGGSVALEHTERGARFTAVLPLLREPLKAETP